MSLRQVLTFLSINLGSVRYYHSIVWYEKEWFNFGLTRKTDTVSLSQNLTGTAFQEKVTHSKKLQCTFNSSAANMEALKNLEKLKESDEEKKKRRCQTGVGQIGSVCGAITMIVIGAIHHEECVYRVVQLDLTSEIEVFHKLFDRFHSPFSMTSLKQHMECFNFLR